MPAPGNDADFPILTPITQLQARLASGKARAEGVLENSLARIGDRTGEGARTMTLVLEARARAEARASDALRRAGGALPPLSGLPITVKDLFDIAGEVTRAGSRVLGDAPPAQWDAPVVARLRQAGAVILGKTNMVEFAFGGVGTNPHYGTPKSVFDRGTGRVPGGSSSGAAISVADGMCVAAIGTDTGGSCRIPAALNGLCGFKPTSGRIPLAGAFPLSPSQDTVGPLAPSVACCALIDAVLSGGDPRVPEALPLKDLRFAVPETLVFDDIEPVVSDAFGRALTRLSNAGAKITTIRLGALAELSDPLRRHGIAAAESFAIHRPYLETRQDMYDPEVLSRINRGQSLLAADYIDLLAWRGRLSSAILDHLAGFDGVLLPTVPIVAPAIADMADPEAYRRANLALLRNTTVGNFLDVPALSVPCHEPDEAPVGLMLFGQPGTDSRVFAIGQSLEACLSPSARA